MSETEKVWQQKKRELSNTNLSDETRDPDKLTKIDVRNIVFFYGTAAVIFGNMLYDWAKSFR